MIYLDTSAATKLVHPEAESTPLMLFLAKRLATPLVSSALLYPELVRAVSRHRPELASRAMALLQRIMVVPLANDIVTNAASIGSLTLRTLDALHLATAAAIGSELDAFVTYDKRLADAASALRLNVVAPA
ncbi:MAG TPA: type II toxin-antitoxin system VapC family toxin [Micromonosporaceae bacterium]|nr:type II toxin-antitoxin system VapC family toxin [Micromonosporaceae bacterium]